jgi:5'-nucleotidase
VTLPLTVEQSGTATATTLTVAGRTKAGQSLRLTAEVLPAAAGMVTFLDGTTELATADVVKGKAKATVQLPVGEHSLTAVFVPAAPAQFAGSTSEPVVVRIVKSGSATSLVVTQESVTFGTATRAVVTVVGKSAPPEGKVQIRDGRTLLLTAELTVSGTTGTARVTLPRHLTTGAHNLTAEYLGSTQVKRSTGKDSLVVTPATPTLTLTAESWSVTPGTRATVAVAVAGVRGAAVPTGTVIVTLDGTRVARATLVTGKVTVVLPRATATAEVEVTYSGDDGYAAASASHLLTVG